MKVIFNVIAGIFVLWGVIDIFGGFKSYPYWAGRSLCDASCQLQVLQCELVMIRGLIMLVLAKMLWTAPSKKDEVLVDKAVEPTL